MRSDVSSQHHRPPNYLIGGRHDDPLLLKEWALVLRGDGKSPRTIEGYSDSVRQLAAFLERGGFPPLTEATAEHVREWLNELRNRGNKAATVNTRYRGVHAFYKWLVEEGRGSGEPANAHPASAGSRKRAAVLHGGGPAAGLEVTPRAAASGHRCRADSRGHPHAVRHRIEGL